MLDSIPESIDPNILIIDDLCLSLNNIKETRTGVSVFSAGSTTLSWQKKLKKLSLSLKVLAF